MATDTAPPIDIEILRTGTHQGVDFTTSSLDEMVSNFEKLRGLHDVPVKAGHNADQPLAKYDGHPALGWISALKRVGDRLVATVTDTPKALREAVRLRRFRKVSVEAYPAWERTAAEANLKTGVKGKVLSALAVLGADIPAVRGLSDIPRLLADERTGADETIRCELPAAPALAGPDTKEGSMATKMTEDQLATLRQQLDALRRDMSEWFDRKLADHRREMNEIVRAAVSEDYEVLNHPFADRLEQLLLEMRLDRTDVTARRTVADIIAEREPYRVPGDPDLRERIITQWAALDPIAKRLEPEGTSRTPDNGASNPLGPWHQPGNPFNPSKNITPAGHQGDTDAHDAFTERFTEVARREGVDLAHATTEQRTKLAKLVASESPEALPLYGYDAQEAERLGGRDRYTMLREIARTHGFRLDRRKDRAAAEQVMWHLEPRTVQGARCYAEGMVALEQRERQLNFAEPADRAAAIRILAQERPDLVVQYGSPRGEDAPETFAEGHSLSDEERQVRFAEEVERRLREQDLPNTPEHRGAAARHVSQMRPDLRPTYGVRRERR